MTKPCSVCGHLTTNKTCDECRILDPEERIKRQRANYKKTTCKDDYSQAARLARQHTLKVLRAALAMAEHLKNAT